MIILKKNNHKHNNIVHPILALATGLGDVFSNFMTQIP